MRNVIIMGAAGRDFHNFNVFFRGNSVYRVVAFSATQIPDIHGRTYPAELAGPGYPDGIPIISEEEIDRLLTRKAVDEAIFAYSDVSHEHVMHRASLVLSRGVDFRLMGPRTTMLPTAKPVVSVCAVRTGSGKSQTTRKIVRILKDMGMKVVVVRHPMPYGDLARQRAQRFSDRSDLDRHECTIEEREEYEPHIEQGVVVFSGVDYEEILRLAELEADVIVWDGGNNDLPFYEPKIHVVLADPHRAGHELTYHPGETNLLMADVVVINKVDTSPPENVEKVRRNVAEVNPQAIVVEAASPVFVDDARAIRGKRVLVVEDGPTITHGEMGYGAGIVAARKWGAGELVDPRPYAVGSLAEVYRSYPHIGPVLPAMGYGPVQIGELEETINDVPCDLVVVATPINLGSLITLNKPAVRVRYELQEIGSPTLADAMSILRDRLTHIHDEALTRALNNP